MLALPVIALCLGGCASDPVALSERIAAEAGAAREVLTGNGFEHVVFTRAMAADARQLHVYLGGDGRPFVNRHRVARDPTPRRPLALQLMLADATPAAYVGRPCYHGARNRACSARMWTSGRYAESVVAGLTDVLGQLIERQPRARVTLVGYSGGGVLALLVAARAPRVDAVVTLAAPLDIEAWTRAHGYTPLHDSINPADVRVWPGRLHQVHVHGDQDRNVAPALVDAFRSRAGAAGTRGVGTRGVGTRGVGTRGVGTPVTFQVIEGFDHVCCWRQAWPGLLDGLLADVPPAAGAPSRATAGNLQH